MKNENDSPTQEDDVNVNQYEDKTSELLGTLISKELTYEDIEKYIAFDDWASFEANPETPTDHLPEHFTPDEIKEAMDNGSIFKALLDENGNFIATYWFEPKPLESELYIYNLVVHPEYRDKGIAKLFLESAEIIAKGKDFKKCTLHVDPLNSRGLYLYTSKGYQVTAYETDPAGGLDNWLIMTKFLKDAPATDDADIRTVEANDEKNLQLTLESGYISTSLAIAEDKNPYKNKITFSRLI